MAVGGTEAGAGCIWSSTENTQHTLPSPPHTSSRALGVCRAPSSASEGPPEPRSNSWEGSRQRFKRRSTAPPWPPRERRLKSTNKGSAPLSHSSENLGLQRWAAEWDSEENRPMQSLCPMASHCVHWEVLNEPAVVISSEEHKKKRDPIVGRLPLIQW